MKFSHQNLCGMCFNYMVNNIRDDKIQGFLILMHVSSSSISSSSMFSFEQMFFFSLSNLSRVISSLFETLLLLKESLITSSYYKLISELEKKK